MPWNPRMRADVCRLLKQTFNLIADGSIEPIKPMTVFPLHEVTEAFRYMRDGKHIGKIVISSSTSRNVQVPVGSPLSQA